MSGNYQKIMEVLKRWPLDKSKGSRDYGLHLRMLTKAAFPAGDVFPGTEEEKNQKYDALMRLADNKYSKMFGSYRKLGATGLSAEQLHEALSEEFVNKYLK